MAVLKVERKTGSGRAYRVRWKDEHGKWGSETFARKQDAVAFDAEIKRRKQSGSLGYLDSGKVTVQEFARVWWVQHVEVHLASATRSAYKRCLDSHVIPKLGKTQLVKLDTQRIAKFQSDLLADGVGETSVRKTVAMLQGILQHAVEWGYLQTNPAKAVRKLKQGRKRAIQITPPETVEAMRAKFLAKDRKRDATLMCTLAYSGLRPGEALALRWADIGAKTITVDKAISDGEEKGTKTGVHRTVRLLAPLRDDLAEWRKASGGKSGSLVFPRPDGTPWKEMDWRNWSRRVYRPIAKSSGLNDTRPYDLRHSFASLLFQEQKLGPVAIAAQLGHNVQTLFNTYAHEIEELHGTRRRSPEKLIKDARAKVNGSESVAPKLPRSPLPGTKR